MIAQQYKPLCATILTAGWLAGYSRLTCLIALLYRNETLNRNGRSPLLVASPFSLTPPSTHHKGHENETKKRVLHLPPPPPLAHTINDTKDNAKKSCFIHPSPPAPPTPPVRVHPLSWAVKKLPLPASSAPPCSFATNITTTLLIRLHHCHGHPPTTVTEGKGPTVARRPAWRCAG